jgi:hypothetical protein
MSVIIGVQNISGLKAGRNSRFTAFRQQAVIFCHTNPAEAGLQVHRLKH